MHANDARGRPERPQDADRHKNSECYELEHSLITIERGGAGPVARIERTWPGYYREYAGPLDQQTVNAIREVANGGR